MLEDHERARIEEEEHIRQQVRYEWEEKRKRLGFGKGRTWSALNNSFVLWVFSSVLLFLLALGFSTYLTASRDRAEKRQIQQKLNIEMESRVQEARTALQLIKMDLENHEEYHSPAFIYGAVLETLNGNSSGVGTYVAGAAYPEFERKSLPGLIYEWQRTARNRDGRSYESVLSTYQELRMLAETSDESQPETPTDEYFRDSLEVVERAAAVVNQIQSGLPAKPAERRFW
ncbi:MAG TPA: hypothetical protein VGB17_08780 [Pyrinomonadaceae bacterium]|jgi:hypothetical protein